jgi:hypothetical protein
MTFIKIGEASDIELTTFEKASPQVSSEALENFRKMAGELRKVAPKANDFLYFISVFMHSAEASAINDDGTPKLNMQGVPVKVGWDTSGGTWKWTSNDPSIKSFKNNNGDIFPEIELIKAHKKWVGKPLCVDHKSSSVDHTRGFIVDTYYDHKLKRVVGLCALDKVNYPELARKVSTGMQTAVSMGTGVGQAICYDCGKVARVESDFCGHMRAKSCYGEINIDLNPIELSIVVNGADPKAHIKLVLAAADNLNTYIENKSQELFKMAQEYNANISFNSGDPNAADGKNSNIAIKATDINKFKEDLDKAFIQLKEISESSKVGHFGENANDGNNLALEQSPNLSFTEAQGNAGSGSELSPPHERFAFEQDLIKITASLENKLHDMKHNLDTLINNFQSKHTQEDTMSAGEMNKKGYYQGTEEPTPGQPKYQKDPANEDLRQDGDKQMVGQKPFPDTGPVDGMHPGVASSGMSELERKKMLARAESEDRAVKRAEAVSLAKQALQNKTGYYLNTTDSKENPGTPTPHKVKYPIDKMNEDLRDNDDRQMVGQKPFPGVGAVDKLHPSPDSADIADELKRKELLQRASLRARFVKAAKDDGSQDLAKSTWEVFLGDKLVLAASVEDLSGGHSDLMYDSIATKEFGSGLIDKVKKMGADNVKSLFKKAQMPPAPPPMPAPEAVGAPGGPEGAPEDTGANKGDPKAVAEDLASKAVEVVSDLKEAVDVLTGEKSEMGDMKEMPASASEDFNFTVLANMRKEINGLLIQDMQDKIATLQDHKDALDMIVAMYDNDAVNETNKDMMETLNDETFNGTTEAISEGYELMSSYVKYAHSTDAILKRAQMEKELDELSHGEQPMSHDEGLEGGSEHDLMDLLNDDNLLDEMNQVDGPDDTTATHDSEDADVSLKTNELDKMKELPAGSTVHVMASYDSKEGRQALRAKLAATSSVKFNPILHEAHPKGGFTTQLDNKPEGDLAKVEDLEEKHEAMLEVATAPVKVRKEAEVIHELISKGELDAKDLDALISQGLDKDAVAYYRKYYSQVDGGSEFANELVKEHVKAQMEKELNTFKVKIARAYELAWDMADRGLSPRDRSAISRQVDDIMKYNDASFESLKSVVAKTPVMSINKLAGKLPQVGLVDYQESAPQNDFSVLSEMFGRNKNKLMF